MRKSSVLSIAVGSAVALVPFVAVAPAQAAVPTSAPVVTAPAAVQAAVHTASSPERKPGSTKATPRVNPPLLRLGATGPAVTSLQTELGTKGYWSGKPSGRYDHSTAQAVMAVQKVAGLGRDGVAGPATRAALDKGVMPKARSTKGRVLEIDLQRQIMLLVVDGKVTSVINTSTGTKATPTPKGTYRVFRQIDRWHTAPLGKLYRPKYFFRGYAVHGVADGSIPGRPASHGCARVSTAAMDMLWKGGLRIGDQVRVY